MNATETVIFAEATVAGVTTAVRDPEIPVLVRKTAGTIRLQLKLRSEKISEHSVR